MYYFKRQELVQQLQNKWHRIFARKTRKEAIKARRGHSSCSRRSFSHKPAFVKLLSEYHKKLKSFHAVSNFIAWFANISSAEKKLTSKFCALLNRCHGKLCSFKNITSCIKNKQNPQNDSRQLNVLDVTRTCSSQMRAASQDDENSGGRKWFLVTKMHRGHMKSTNIRIFLKLYVSCTGP